MNSSSPSPHLVANVTTLTGLVDRGAAATEAGNNYTVEAYTVVLSTAAHVTSMVFGGGSSVAVIGAVTRRGANINKCSYLLVLTLFFACCCVNFVWSPLEVTDMLVHHFHHRHPTTHFVAGRTALYVCLVALVHVVILLLSVEGMVRTANRFGRGLQRVWPLAASLLALGWAVILTAIFISKTADSPDSSATHSYVMTDSATRQTFLAIAVVIVSLSCLTLACLVVQFLKIRPYCKNGCPRLRRQKMKIVLPEFLISQSQQNNPCCHDDDDDDDEDEEMGGYDNVNEPSTSRSPSPSTPKLLTVSSPDSASDKQAPPMSGTTPKSTSSNRLGIGISQQILGRRRHTICQISDMPTGAPSDPVAKAKQYNYVRKFSVDISALQAQLQNPKIFKDAPFQSDIDLAKKAAADDAKPRGAPKPLQPLTLNLGEKKDTDFVIKSAGGNDLRVDTPKSAGLSAPPPVITVSNEDAVLSESDGVADDKDNTKNDDEKPAVGNNVVVFDFNNHHGNNRPEKPTSLPLKKDDDDDNEDHRIDEVMSVPTLESAMTEDASDTEMEGNKLARLAGYMGITFVLCTAPVLVTEALRSSMTSHAFVNISTCTLAISAIQTIVYPHLIASTDDVVHRGVQRLNQRLRQVFCRGEMGQQQTHVDDNSSTSQV